ncbi:hypothetical protein [Archaeoglobus neptunius]|uniref:hypothetical protein n=1 Tax=Archaeoglobus neptunius TaxID=2798580 RepID=UPI0019280667|nr:hypothetical protein [Archaeoglobus neptunius]
MIANATDFALNGVLTPISDFFALIYGMLELVTKHITPEHTDFVYAQISAILWVVKFFGAIADLTASNSTLLFAFADTLHSLSTNSRGLFGDIDGLSGISYIARHTYIELTQNKQISEEIAVRFVRAMNSTVIYFMKVFEFL